jgi:hypothetical protein
MPINQIGFGPKTTAFPTVPVTLTSGGTYVIPSGQYQVVPGQYTFFQWYDPISQIWRPYQTPAQSDSYTISSDGNNYRLANLTGTVVGAVITNAGTGYTNGIYPPSAQLGTAAAPSVTVAAGGGSVLARGTLIVGGAIPTAAGNFTITGGGGYTYAPTVLISPPPAGGVQATATATISSNAVSAITITNQGAGYTAAPTITIVPNPLDTAITTAATVVTSSTFALAGSGTVTAITFSINGAGMTSVPALSFSPASTTAATAIMCWTATTVTFTGASNAGNGNFGLIGSTVTAGSATLTNPAISTGIFTPRFGQTAFSTTATPTTTTIVDGGLHQIVPNAVLVTNSNGTISAATTTTIAQGGVTDISYIIPM